MKLNFIRTFIVFILIFMYLFSNVYAIDLFLTNRSSDNSSENILQDDEIELGNDKISVEEPENADTSITTYGENNNLENENSNNEELESTSVLVDSSPTITSTVSTDNSLTTSDIINIILISVCIVLIFLAIAILIRCK